jgi:hypothetical protein
MGTRSLTIVKESIDPSCEDIIVMYKQFDGYPEGLGLRLANFLKGFIIINGIPPNPNPKSANGMHDLAAQLVAEFTNGIGEIYLHPSGTRDVWEEFIYYIYLGPDNILRIQVVQACRIKDNQSGEWSMVEDKIFDGTPTEVKKWILG